RDAGVVAELKIGLNFVADLECEGFPALVIHPGQDRVSDRLDVPFLHDLAVDVVDDRVQGLMLNRLSMDLFYQVEGNLPLPEPFDFYMGQFIPERLLEMGG